DGSILRHAADLAPGERLTTHLAEGTVESEVISTAPTSLGEPITPPPITPPPTSTRHPKPAKPQRGKPPAEADQLDLFGKRG
ncbi:hypothetical protein MNBD_PLANCTO03-728, partial [hydrothermal vent metagenome]